MRPLEVTLEGFRSYRHRVTFDFRNRRLVGIVGPIGAGKSSLLDAVAFALYGKTPTFEKETRSLIHQLCDSAHVELLFEVDGQLWRAQRGLKRKGQSGHKLERLDPADPQKPPLESIQQDRNVRERVERLLGMDFSAFCRSVLLAQNRFQEFLMATPTQRNEVLKGVFGYERFDAALAVAKDRVRDAEVELKTLDLERARLAEARTQRDEAADAARAAAERLALLDREGPQMKALADAAAQARRSTAEGREQAELLRTIAQGLPDAEDLAASLDQASGAAQAVERAEKADEEAEKAAAAAQAQLSAVSERVGDRNAFVVFAQLVERHHHEAEVVTRAGQAASQAAEAAAQAATVATAATTQEAGARSVRDRAETALAQAQAAVEEAETRLHQAGHAEMAAELRGELEAGAPCPVCEQPVGTLPGEIEVPAVREAEELLAAAKKGQTAAQRAHSAAGAALATATERVTANAAQAEDARSAAERAEHERVRAEAAVAATKSELVDRLGEGDPQGLLEAREAELSAAEAAARDAAEAAREAHGISAQARSSATAAAAQVGKLATALTLAWAQIGEPREVVPQPSSVHGSATELSSLIAEKIALSEEEARGSTLAEQEAMAELAERMRALGLEPATDFVAERASAAALSAAADARLKVLEQTLASGADIAERVRDVEARKALAARLASHLQPSQFLSFLLEEERGALAELGSHHLEQLTGGAYRFTSDDSFRIVDVNAGAVERSADSLSGGETFLASLALALALAEMVARGGGRLDAFFLDEGFGSLDAEHIELAMDGVGRLVSGSDGRLVVLVSHVEQMKQMLEDLIVLEKDAITGDTVIVSGATPSA